jgi:NAD(P)-dependent dehydrogenase (short-subunit alcohol dehydrogenase family)
MMTIRLDKRVAIVTGAGRGLGRAHALALAERGARLLINDLDIVAANAVADDIRTAGGEAIGFAANVTDREAVSSMVEAATDRWGRVDILVNNAGILRDKSFSKMSLDDFKLVIDVHLMGAVHCIKSVWDGMRERRHGRIILTTSSSGLYGNFGQANYASAKMALVGLMQTLSIEGERYGIHVNCLAPSASTEMTQGLYSDAILAGLEPAAVSPAVVALASERAPNRIILLAGAGNFSQAHIGMTRGIYLGGEVDVAGQLLSNLERIDDRKEQIIPRSGAEQHQFEFERAARGNRGPTPIT